MSAANDIRSLRVAAGLTQHQVAAAVGISQPKLSLIELGQRSTSDDELLAIKKAIVAAFRTRAHHLLETPESIPA